jgi:hypothetical protein
MSHEGNSNGARGASGKSLSRAGVLVLLFTIAALVEAAQLASLRNYDVWEHLRIGSWILANKTWPTTGLFSQAVNFPWRDFNWLGDVKIAIGYRILGLSAVVVLWMGYRFMIAVVTFGLAGGLRGNFWLAAGLSAVAQYLLFGLGPIAGGNSVLFFAVELMVLLEIRRAGRFQSLFWLTPLFLLWANVDLGFVYGLGMLVVFVVALIVEKLLAKNISEAEQAARKDLEAVVWAVAACVLASFVSPYGYHAYSTFFAVQASPANRYIFEYTAMTFHQPQDYVLLLLTMAAFLALGLRRSRDLFLIPTFVGCAALSFYAQHDNWLAILGAIAVIGNATAEGNLVRQEEPQRRLRWLAAPAVVSLGLVMALYGLLVPRDRNVLLGRVAENLPVRACDYIRQQQLPAPLFNTQTWGSFLTWYLPEYPVAIDARRALYPGQWETDYFRVMKVLAPYQDFAPMMQARTLLLYNHSVMADALRNVAGFRVAYEDNLAVVLVRDNGTPASSQEFKNGTASN